MNIQVWVMGILTNEYETVTELVKENQDNLSIFKYRIANDKTREYTAHIVGKHVLIIEL